MKHSLYDRVLTLAGIFQATALVKRTATQGRQIDKPVETCLSSLFVQTADNVDELYGNCSQLRLGLQTLINQMGNHPQQRDIDLTRYTITLLHLEKKLNTDKALMEILAKGLDVAKSQSEYFSLSHENVIASLGDLYQRTVSTLRPVILVNGEREYLQDTANASLIRALLLAGIRSAVAWRQCGGTRLQLLFKRKAIVSEASRILDKLPSIDTLI